jgi:hypothetical protein
MGRHTGTGTGQDNACAKARASIQPSRTQPGLALIAHTPRARLYAPAASADTNDAPMISVLLSFLSSAGAGAMGTVSTTPVLLMAALRTRVVRAAPVKLACAHTEAKKRASVAMPMGAHTLSACVPTDRTTAGTRTSTPRLAYGCRRVAGTKQYATAARSHAGQWPTHLRSGGQRQRRRDVAAARGRRDGCHAAGQLRLLHRRHLGGGGRHVA